MEKKRQEKKRSSKIEPHCQKGQVFGHHAHSYPCRDKYPVSSIDLHPERVKKINRLYPIRQKVGSLF
jgi:hypothetical protein